MQSLHLDTVGAMDAAAALADLVEISPQIEAAAVVGADGELAGSVGIPEERAGVLARVVRELLDGAAAIRSDEHRVTQLHAELAGGGVFAVAAHDRAVVAVARERATQGLIFYDLKRCLAEVGGEA
jgi:predicted regulator of Ras-like GTPase activity (Roadblock/LC7/MglB family)